MFPAGCEYKTFCPLRVRWASSWTAWWREDAWVRWIMGPNTGRSVSTSQTTTWSASTSWPASSPDTCRASSRTSVTAWNQTWSSSTPVSGIFLGGGEKVLNVPQVYHKYVYLKQITKYILEQEIEESIFEKVFFFMELTTGFCMLAASSTYVYPFKADEKQNYLHKTIKMRSNSYALCSETFSLERCLKIKCIYIY